MAKTPLHQAILQTVAYFAVFNQPLSNLEICQFLWWPAAAKIDQYVILMAVNELLQAGEISCHQGLYGPPGLDWSAQRLAKTNTTEKKFLKVKKIGRLLALLPEVEMLAVTNRLAFGNVDENSDIDLFVVAKSDRAWTTRFFCLLLLKIFRLRPTTKKQQDKFCLSFFVDRDHLDISSLPDNSERHLVYLAAQLYPVYGQSVYDQFVAQNQWIKNYLPFYEGVVAHQRRLIKLSWPEKIIKSILAGLFGWSMVEKMLTVWQMKILPNSLRQQINQHPGVVIRPGIIKLINKTSDDRRHEYQQKFLNFIKYDA